MGFFIPLQIEDNLLYCEVYPIYDSDHDRITYSMAVKHKNANNIIAHGEIPGEGDFPFCIDYFPHNFIIFWNEIKIPVWQQVNGHQPTETLTSSSWEQDMDKNSAFYGMWCPYIPYVDMNQNTIE